MQLGNYCLLRNITGWSISQLTSYRAFKNIPLTPEDLACHLIYDEFVDKDLEGRVCDLFQNRYTNIVFTREILRKLFVQPSYDHGAGSSSVRNMVALTYKCNSEEGRNILGRNVGELLYCTTSLPIK
jgi:hypothetical protein